MKIGKKIILIVLSFTMLFPAKVISQEVYESEGKNFWLTFLPNYHNSNTSNSTDSIYIFITSEQPTKGSISYKSYYRGKYQDTIYHFEIKQANAIHKFAIHPYYYELKGFNNSGNLTAGGNDNETILNYKTFYVQTEHKSSVYAFEYAAMSAEAFIVLPTPSLGNEYYVLAYNSDGSLGMFDISGSSTPSQFAIVATEDNTNITIEPNCRTYKTGNKNAQNIVMNKGEVYLVQALINRYELNNDLSGTHIIADKKIAVFSGHQRTTLPVKPIGGVYSPSRDCLIEQLVPTHAWGRNAILTPFAEPSDYQKSDNKDIFRVIAARNDTRVFFNNTELCTLNAGEFLEKELEAGLLTANRPILVASYKRTSKFSSSFLSRGIGDPLMLVIPPVEQFKNRHNIVNAQLENNKIITEQYLTIIAHDTSINKIYVDNQLIDKNKFITIPKSGFSYAHIRTTDNGHKITSEDNIAVQIYGYGVAVSYGYMGGMNFKDLEKDKIIYKIDTCAGSIDFMYNEIFSSGIKKYEITEKVNCNIIEKKLTNKHINLQIEKIDKTKPAYYTIKIIDIYDAETIFKDSVFSYIINIKGLPNEDNKITFGKCKVGTINTQKFSIQNNSSFDILIDNSALLLSEKTNFTIAMENLPKNLKSGEKMDVKICYAPTYVNPKEQTIDYDTLKLNKLCINENIYLSGVPIADTLDFSIKCDIPIRMIADSVDVSIEVPVIYPNPSSNNSFYKFTLNEKQNIKMDIFGTDGQFIQNILDTYMPEGNYEISLPIYNLKTGSYLVKLQTKNKTFFNKFIIHK
ncbi:MAG: T9SS type A sorting domain-containing protein [Ignavibacteria bacterium]|jgi:hypothetical protein|nr:T9SS type A sorting domain-containing protein [Ignavibacteria bacterium]